jgi:hypothetical protein
MRHLVDTAVATSSGRPRFVFYIDEDDFGSLRTAELMRGHGHDVRWVVEPRHTRPMSDWWNVCAERAGDDTWAVMFVDDEANFVSRDWDIQLMRALDQGAILVQPNDTIHGDACAGYYFVHWPTWRQVFGRLTPPHFTYGYADVWALEVAKAAGVSTYLPDLVIENLAPKLQPPDQTHADNAARAERDRPGDLYHATQSEREEEVRKLRAYTESRNP